MAATTTRLTFAQRQDRPKLLFDERFRCRRDRQNPGRKESEIRRDAFVLLD